AGRRRRGAERVRQRWWHSRRRREAPVRAVLHDQAAGDGTRAVDHEADHRGARRRGPVDEPAGQRHALHDPAAAQEDAWLSRRTSWSPTTIRGCARASSARSEEHTSELSHVAISYAVFCLKKKKKEI